MRHRARKLLIGTLTVAAILEVLYLGAANTALNGGMLEKRLNRRPDRFEIHWRSGWSLWPGTISLQDVRLRGSSRRLDWQASLDSVGATFDLLPLKSRRVHLRAVRAAGVDYRQRHKSLPGDTSRIPEADLPPIPEVTPEQTVPPPPGPSRRWTILADDIVCDVDQIWIERFRLAGRMQVSTSMFLVPRHALEFPGVRLTMRSGGLFAGKEAIFEALGMDVQAQVHRFVPRGLRRLDFFHYLSGRFDLSSDSASLFFLEAYFRKTPWVRFNDRGKGHFVVVLDHGEMREGTRLEMANDRVDMEFLDRHLIGRGVIRGAVNQDAEGRLQSDVTARLTEFQVAAAGRSQPLARGDLAVLQARSHHLDLADPFDDLEVRFDLPRAEIVDLSYYNTLIPAGSGFRLLSGSGTMSYHLEGSQEERSLHGTIDLVVDEGAASFRDYEMRGGFSVHGLLRQASPQEMLFDIAGTRVEVRKRNPDWSASFLFPKARMRFTDPMALDATLRLKMQDTRPLVAMFDALKGVPDWLERMMTIPDLQGTAELVGRGDQMSVRDLDVMGTSLHALADLDFENKSRDGILYLNFHGFSFGIHLLPDGKNIKIVRPLSWFHAERARRRGASPPASGAPARARDGGHR